MEVVVVVNGKAAVTARAKARQAKAELDAQRAEQDRLVVDAATEFYEAADALTAAQAAVVAAEQQRTKAVARLSKLGQTDDQVATLCDLPVKEIRELRRRATTDAAETAPATDDPAPGARSTTETATTETAPTETAAA